MINYLSLAVQFVTGSILSYFQSRMQRVQMDINMSWSLMSHIPFSLALTVISLTA